jgi:hypothetical protein
MSLVPLSQKYDMNTALAAASAVMSQFASMARSIV